MYVFNFCEAFTWPSTNNVRNFKRKTSVISRVKHRPKIPKQLEESSALFTPCATNTDKLMIESKKLNLCTPPPSPIVFPFL